MSQEAALQEKVERLVRRLEEVRRTHAEQPEEDRRAAFERTLDEELGRVPAAEADRVLEDVRARLIQTARERDQRVEELERRVREQASEIEALDAKLKSRPEPVPAPAVAPVSGDAPDLDRVRAAMTQVVEGKALNVADLGLSPQDAALYSLILGLMQFTISYGQSRMWILSDLDVVPPGDSRVIEIIQGKTKRLIRGCLAGDASAGEALQAELHLYAKFLTGLNESYVHSIDAGSRSLLRELGHQELLEKHKKTFGQDYEAAWKELEGVHAGLSDLSHEELWEQYFLEPFRKKLGQQGNVG